jgi:hypothetical protein
MSVDIHNFSKCFHRVPISNNFGLNQRVHEYHPKLEHYTHVIRQYNPFPFWYILAMSTEDDRCLTVKTIHGLLQLSIYDLDLQMITNQCKIASDE